MFAIRILPPTRLGPDGQRLGEIVVGDFHEVFACHSNDIAKLEAHWREQLRALLEGEPLAVLQRDPRFAWVAYNEDPICYIRQWLSIDGSFRHLLPRMSTTEDGERISEWTTSLAAIRQFLNA
jgi:hypothetical protein